MRILEVNFDEILKPFGVQLQQHPSQANEPLDYSFRSVDRSNDNYIDYRNKTSSRNTDLGYEREWRTDDGSARAQIRTLRFKNKSGQVDASKDYVRVTASKQREDRTILAVTMVKQGDYSDLVRCESEPQERSLVDKFFPGSQAIEMMCYSINSDFCKQHSNTLFREAAKQKRYPITESQANEIVRKLERFSVPQNWRSMTVGFETYLLDGNLKEQEYNNGAVIKFKHLHDSLYRDNYVIKDGDTKEEKQEKIKRLEEQVRKVVGLCNTAYPETMRFYEERARRSPAPTPANPSRSTR